MGRPRFEGRPKREESWSPAIPAHISKGADKSIEELGFEGALRELEAIVSRLEQGEVDLEDSIALYERGQALKAHCEKKLKSAEGRLEKIVLGEGRAPEIGAPESKQKLETA